MTDWDMIFAREAAKPYWAKLMSYVADERAAGQVYPPEAQRFAAFDLTPFDQVRVVILGQDPYHGAGQANGLSFSVEPPTPVPPSLANIHKELLSDVGVPIPEHGCLGGWARQGVLLLNTCLTVRDSEAGSHRGHGWEDFTDAVIGDVNDQTVNDVAFILWGKQAQAKRKLITDDRHLVVEAPHPSPLSSYRGFFGSQPFSKVDEFLDAAGKRPINWANLL